MLQKLLMLGLFVLSVFVGTQFASAKPEYFMKEKAARPEITCMTCHQAIPKAGDADKKLNDVGKAFMKDHKLPAK